MPLFGKAYAYEASTGLIRSVTDAAAFPFVSSSGVSPHTSPQP
jgi:hypothetical protein